MNGRKTTFAISAAWDFARFFIVLTIAIFIFRSSSGWGISVEPWLLAASAAGLLIPVGELLLCLYPERYANLLGFMVLGKVLNVFSLLLLFFFGALSSSIRPVLFSLGRVGITETGACSVVALLDLSSLALVTAFGAGLIVPRRPDPAPAPQLPEYSEEEIKDYH
jgi:hypothetical protein